MLLPECDAQTKTKFLKKYFRGKHPLEHASGLPKTVCCNRLYYIIMGMFSKTIEHLPLQRD